MTILRAKGEPSKGYVELTIGKKVYDLFINNPLTRLEIIDRTGIAFLGAGDGEHQRFLVLQCDSNGSPLKPFKIILDGQVYWFYFGKLYRDDDDLKADDVKVLLDAREERKSKE
jgi:hypothetical protein